MAWKGAACKDRIAQAITYSSSSHAQRCLIRDQPHKEAVASDPVNDDGRAWITRLDLKGRAVASRFSLRLK
ncbi:hypothetical protein J6590_058874 [Homalodisca vitripennis]|nr:hypothetical protein J6590_058874 [Homalodisca vitripennis]